MGKTTEAHEALLEHCRIVAFWVLLLGLALGLLAGYVLTGRALGPIRRLIAAVHRVLATGQMDDRVPLRAGPGDELHELTALFNPTLEKNAALLRGMRAVLDTVAHDLRTPLPRLPSRAERTHVPPPAPPDLDTHSDPHEKPPPHGDVVEAVRVHLG